MRKVLSLFIFLFCDFIFLSLSFFFAFILRKDIFAHLFPASYTFPFSVFSARYYFLLLFLFIFTYEGLYTKIYPPEEELRRIWRGLSIFFLTVLSFAFITRIGGFSRFIVVCAFFFSLIFLPLERWILKSCLYSLGLWGRKLLLTGSSVMVERVKRELLRNKETGVIIKELAKGGENGEGVIIAKEKISAQDLLPYSPPSVKEVFLFTGEPLFSTHQAEIERMGTLFFIRLRYNLLSPFNLFLKRLLELILSSLIFFLTLPLFLLISILIKLSSPGPVFFVQERVGERGKRFICRKFRTMVAGAASEGNLSDADFMKMSGVEVSRIRGDAARMTPIGKFLRRTSLDELPQFLNLFAGEMSLIGPRPYLPKELERAGRYIDIITRVKPGITGLWQVSGRADLSFEERFLLDEYYVKNWSLWLDLYIFLKTFWVILRGKGAY